MPEGEQTDPKDKPNKDSEPGWENPGAWHRDPISQEAWNRILEEDAKRSEDTPPNSEKAEPHFSDDRKSSALDGFKTGISEKMWNEGMDISQESTPHNQEKPPEAPKK